MTKSVFELPGLEARRQFDELDPCSDALQHLSQQNALSTLTSTKMIGLAAGELIPVPPFHKKTGEDVH